MLLNVSLCNLAFIVFLSTNSFAMKLEHNTGSGISNRSVVLIMIQYRIWIQMDWITLLTLTRLCQQRIYGRIYTVCCIVLKLWVSDATTKYWNVFSSHQLDLRNLQTCKVTSKLWDLLAVVATGTARAKNKDRWFGLAKNMLRGSHQRTVPHTLWTTMLLRTRATLFGISSQTG